MVGGTDTAKRPSPMGMYIQVNTKWISDMGLGDMNGKTVGSTTGILFAIKGREMVPIVFRMVLSILEDFEPAFATAKGAIGSLTRLYLTASSRMGSITA
jgi:hypothetical protein